MATAVSKRSLLLNEMKNINPMVGDMDIQGAIQQAGQAKMQGQRLATLTAQGGPRIGVDPMAQKVYAPAPPRPAPQPMTPPQMNATPGIVPMNTPAPTLSMDLRNNATGQRVNNNVNTRLAENTSRMNTAFGGMSSIGERGAFLDQTNPDFAGGEASMARAKATGDAVRPTGAYNWIHEVPVNDKPQRWVTGDNNSPDDRLSRMMRFARTNPSQAPSPEEMALNMARFKNTSSVKTQGATMDSEMGNIAPSLALDRAVDRSKMPFTDRIAGAEVAKAEQSNMSQGAWEAKQAAMEREAQATSTLPVATQMELQAINGDLPTLQAQLTNAMTLLKDNPDPIVRQQVLTLQQQIQSMIDRKTKIFGDMQIPQAPLDPDPSSGAPSGQPAPRTPQSMEQNRVSADMAVKRLRPTIDSLNNRSGFFNRQYTNNSEKVLMNKAEEQIIAEVEMAKASSNEDAVNSIMFELTAYLESYPNSRLAQYLGITNDSGQTIDLPMGY